MQRRTFNIKDDHFIGKIKSYGPTLRIKTLGKYGLLFRSVGDSKWHYQESFKLNELCDTCGAGDWCTVGFLFYLEELATKNNISLIETLKSNYLINSALSFAQILASLSCRFVGARGLSYSMDQKKIIRTVRCCMKKNSDINLFINKNLGKKNSQIITKIIKKMDKSYACPTCLLTY